MSNQANSGAQAPARYDYDENVQIQNGVITEKKAWLPFVAYPVAITFPVSDKVKFK